MVTNQVQRALHARVGLAAWTAGSVGHGHAPETWAMNDGLGLGEVSETEHAVLEPGQSHQLVGSAIA
ncbi:MAG: hypothetical protein M3492_04105 [Actinomycetota bacterium]|nr:hypothetical protein [Actinomycetota bacterium]